MFTVDFANINEVVSNHIIPFALDKAIIRGRVIGLRKQIHTILSGHRYPPIVSKALGELVVNAAMIGSMLKLDGIISIQISGTGPVKFMNADYTSEGHIRGYAKIAEHTEVVKLKVKENEQPHLNTLCGEGRVVVTIETKNYQPYQAIIPLSEKTITDCIVNYYKSSEQLESDIVVLVKQVNKQWRAGGVLIQKVASEGGNTNKQQNKHNKIWKKATWALANLDPALLCQSRLVPDQLLESVFLTSEIELFSGIALQAKCRCSRERMRSALSLLSLEERKTLLKKGVYEVTCQICNKRENFTEEQVIVPNNE